MGVRIPPQKIVQTRSGTHATSCLVGAGVICKGVKWPGRKFDHYSTLYNAAAMHKWNYTSSTPECLHGLDRDNLVLSVSVLSSLRMEAVSSPELKLHGVTVHITHTPSLAVRCPFCVTCLSFLSVSGQPTLTLAKGSPCLPPRLLVPYIRNSSETVSCFRNLKMLGDVVIKKI